MSKEDIIKKIQKLLAVSKDKGASENEAMMAADIVQKLLQAHNLSLGEIKNNESVERHALKFPDKAEFMRIAEIMVNNEYARGNSIFFLYVDMDESKIRGNINDELREEALNQYINENYNALLKPFLVQRDGTKKKHTTETAIKEIKQRLTSAYF
jgi:hypothetical protein